MTILMIDGFDIYEAADDAAMTSSMEAGMWGEGNGIKQETQAANVRTGRGAMKMTGPSDRARTIIYGSTSTMVFGIGYRPTSGTQPSGVFASIDHNDGTGGPHNIVLVGYDSLRRLSLWHGSASALIAQSSANAITFNTYQYIEVKAVAGSTTAGEVVARINEVEVCRASGLNLTRGTRTPTFNRVTLAHLNFNVDIHYFDDFYLLNGEGAVNNDFLGQVEVQTHYPEANGDQNDFAVAGTSVAWGAVNDAVSDADATYIHSSTVGAKDLFKVSSLTTGVTDVFAVMPVVKVRKATAGSNSMYLLTRVSGVQASSTLKTPDTNYQFFNHVFETQPAGGDWTVAAVSALQVGLVIASTT